MWFAKASRQAGQPGPAELPRQARRGGWKARALPLFVPRGWPGVVGQEESAIFEDATAAAFGHKSHKVLRSRFVFCAFQDNDALFDGWIEALWNLPLLTVSHGHRLRLRVGEKSRLGTT